jgi:hypothetical protein
MITILLDHIVFGSGRKYRQIMDGIQPPWTCETFARQALRMGVHVIPSANFSTQDRQLVEGVRICIGPPKNEAETARGAGILASILAKPAIHDMPFM